MKFFFVPCIPLLSFLFVKKSFNKSVTSDQSATPFWGQFNLKEKIKIKSFRKIIITKFSLWPLRRFFRCFSFNLYSSQKLKTHSYLKFLNNNILNGSGILLIVPSITFPSQAFWVLKFKKKNLLSIPQTVKVF